MTTVVIAGAVANKAGNGGETWVRLSWVEGLRRLGFDVHLVEQLALGAPAGAAGYFGEVVAAFGLDATLVDAGGATVCGLPPAELAELCAASELLVNISGHLDRQELFSRFRKRLYVDLDPVYTQLWHAEGLVDLGAHHHWYTVGLGLGQPGCRVPGGDVAWRPILPPVVLDRWPVQPAPEWSAEPRFTTIASWRGGSGTVVLDGFPCGAKAREFRRFADLPGEVPATLEIALDIHPADAADQALLLERGWRLVDPATATGTPDAFRAYVQRSWAEFSVAQQAYVVGRCGWFSDRTTRYLASGRPAVVQDTGFSANLPVGEGLLTFREPGEAAHAVRAVTADPVRHAAAARALAEEYFAAERVLGRLCEELDVAP